MYNHNNKMEHKCETTMTYVNEKGDLFYVVRDWEGGVGRFVKHKTGRKGYGKFWNAEGTLCNRYDMPHHFTRTAMNGRNGLVERLFPKQ